MSNSNAPVKTGMPKIIHNNLATSVDYLEKSTNLSKLIENYRKEIAIAYEYNKNLNSSDPIRNIAQFFSSLNEGIDINGEIIYMDDLSQEFQLYWIKKYLTSHKKIKEEFAKLNNVFPDDNYFQKLSDSIGLLARSDENTLDTHIQMYETTYKNINITAPFTVPAPHNNKLDQETKQLIHQISRAVNGNFRTNMSKMINVIATAEVAHGENLVTDYKHLQRVKSVGEELIQEITNELGVIYDVIAYIENSFEFDRQVLVDIKNMNTIIRDSKIEIDFLGNRKEETPSLFTNQNTLSVED